MSEPTQTNQTSERPDKYGLRSYTRKRPRSLIPYTMVAGTKPLFVRALAWLLPWSIHDYPGKQRGMVEALGRLYTLETLKMWCKGRKPMSAVGALALAEVISVRLVSGASLVAELRHYAEIRSKMPRQGPGFRKVDPITGQDGRPKIGRRRAKEV